MPIVKKAVGGKVIPAASEETKRNKAFDETPAAGNVTPGRYNSVIEEMVLQDADEKGQSVRAKYKIVDEGDHYGEDATAWYKIFEADGSTAQGIKFLKRDFAVLGHSEVTLDTLPGICEELTNEHAAVVVSVAKNKKNPQFTNIFLDGPANDSEAAEKFLATNPF